MKRNLSMCAVALAIAVATGCAAEETPAKSRPLVPSPAKATPKKAPATKATSVCE